MLDKIACFNRSYGYWLFILITGIALEAVALFYQYGLGYGPCILCIHVRIWVMALIILAVLGLFSRRNRQLRITTNLLTLIAAIGLTERSWMTFAIERNLIEGSCTWDSGLPDWFALDRWFPSLFEPWELCGWTPELLFGITMAEGLLVFCAGAVAISLISLIASITRS